MAEHTSAAKEVSDRFMSVFRCSRFEIIPFASVMDQLIHVPDNTTVTVTCSPKKSIEHTLDMTRNILEKRTSLNVIPHIPARMIQNESHLDAILSDLKSLKIGDIFMPGGDINPAKGDYESAMAVLDILASKSHHLKQIGITGYPEGHALISEDVLWDSLVAKSNYANYIVTQMCFEPNTILKWIRLLRERNIYLPVLVGVPGRIERKQLLDMSLRLGIGESIKFLKKQSGFFKHLFGFKSIQSTSEPIINFLMEASLKEDLNISGFHVYTFNQLEASMLWWQALTNAKLG